MTKMKLDQLLAFVPNRHEIIQKGVKSVRHGDSESVGA